MIDSVLRIDIEREPPPSGLNRLKRYFSRSKDSRYRFCIQYGPSQPNPSKWTDLAVLGVPRDQLAYLRYNFPSEDELEKIGSAFAKAIFNQEIYTMYLQSFTKLGERGGDQKLRLFLTFDGGIDQQAANVPWECIFQNIKTNEKEHFGLSQNLSVARYIPRPDALPLPIDRLRVMGVAPNPHKCAAPLDVANEVLLFSKIADERKDAVDFRQLPNATLQKFIHEYSGFNPHVLIFTGHGAIVKKKPCLLFQTDDADCHPVSATEFANVLKPLKYDLRMVILSACETALVEGDDPFSSAAAELITAGIPVVIAMQSKVEETAAREFGLRFFTYLLQRQPIDTCVNAGRLAMLEDERDHQRIGRTQWAVPVLFLSTREEIFAFKPTSTISPPIERHRGAQKVKFPRRVRPFIERPAIDEELKHTYAEPGVTFIYGPFGAGKTQLITSFCSSLIETPPEEAAPLFLYLKCSERFDTFAAVLTDLDRQGKSFNFDLFGSILGQAQSSVLAELEGAQTEGLLGITEILGRAHPDDDLENIKRFVDLLAEHRLVIVFDDYVWNGPHFWSELLEQLIVYLQVSKVFVITSSNYFADLNGDFSTVKVTGFKASETESFLRMDNRFDETMIGKVMEVAASVDYLPWYVKIIRDSFKGEPVGAAEVPIEDRADDFIREIDLKIDERQRAVLKQLSLLRTTITLRNLATMMNPTEPSKYWPAALALQGASLLTLTRNLSVELPADLKRYYLRTMSLDDLIQYHQRAAEFYRGFAALPAG